METLELDIEELKKEATQLGITYSPNIGAAKLQGKIDEYYKSQETSEKELMKAVEDAAKNEKSEEKSAVTGKGSLRQRIMAAKEEANKTRVITIIDNDQRVNNKTTTCTVNCSNMYFDLGTVILPLNMPVEVRIGHINVLKEERIPQHQIDYKTGMSTVRRIPRYTISYEDVK